MRAVIQRVSRASVTIDDHLTSSINTGLLVLVGIENADNEMDLEWMSNKIINLRIFNDEQQVMNLSVKEIKGDILVISQFTLYASTKKGNRPSYTKAGKPDRAILTYQKLITRLATALEKRVYSGEFGANMKIELLNDGPVTIVMDSKVKE